MSHPWQTLNSTEEIAKAIMYRNLRLMYINNAISDLELEEVNARTPWSAPNNRKNNVEYMNITLNKGKNINFTVINLTLKKFSQPLATE